MRRWIIVASLLLGTTAAAEVRWLHPRPQGNDLAAVWGQGGTMWVAGARGTLLRSADGKQFELIQTGLAGNLRALCTLGTGLLAVGDGGVVLRSPDKGATWHRIDVGGGERLLGVWGTGREIYVVGESGTALRSTDGALRFQPLETPDEASWVAVAGDRDDVYLLGRSGAVAWSGDKGKTWKLRREGRFLERGALAVSPAGEVLVVAGGQSHRSSDRGATWTSAPVPAPAAVAALWLDGKDAIAAGAAGTLVRSSDAGASWQDLAPGPRELLDDVWVGPARTWIVGAAGVILTSGDGARWERVSAPTQVSLYAVTGTGDDVYVVGDRGTILKGGARGLRALESGVTVQLEDVLALSDTEILVVGYDQFLRSPDAGKTWDAMRHPATRDLNGLWRSGERQPVWAVGDGGVILRWLPPRDEWDKLDAGTAADLQAVWGRGKELWVAGENTVLRSDDGGDSWRELAAPHGSYRALWGGANGAVFLAAGDGRLVVTRDGGKSFRTLFTAGAGLDGLSGRGDHLLVVGEGGTILSAPP